MTETKFSALRWKLVSDWRSPSRNGRRIAPVDRLDANAVEAVRIVVHKDAFRKRVHLLERFHKLFAFAEIDLAAAVGEVLHEFGVCLYEREIVVDLRDDPDIFELGLREKVLFTAFLRSRFASTDKILELL